MIGAGLPTYAGTEAKLHVPTNRVKKTPALSYNYTPDLLLIMPNAAADNDDVAEILKDAKGTIVGSMGHGKMTCIIYKTEKGHMIDTERKFMKDKEHFNMISRNYQCTAQMVPNDPQFTSQWHLGAVNAPSAWNTTIGASTPIAIFDSGCQSSNGDLNGKTQKGYNATTFWAHLTTGAGSNPLGNIFGGIGGDLSGGARTDVQGHGTFVATTAAASCNNNFDTAGVAPGSTVYPIQIADSSGKASDISIMAGLLNAPDAGCRIINISYNSAPPLGMSNAALHAPLHAYLKDFHDNHNGLIFMAAGNNGAFDANPAVPYVDFVSAVDPTLGLTTFSNFGNSITFTAPGQGIVCSARDGSVQSVDGTSFASPIVASIAALVWNANPRLSNTQVENILKASCSKAGSANWTQYYGYGMPDAAKAVKLATGG
jgi:subtilisin family serine protease